jgi:hypothetical protein
MELPAGAKAVALLGVDYGRLKTHDRGDLYLTQFGLPICEHLIPENWYEPDWFATRRIPLEGTSTIYRLASKPVRGRALDLIVRFSRMGQQIPLGTEFFSDDVHAEFNSPFEEFALVMALRTGHCGSPRPRMFTKKPLAIYVPAAQHQDWQTGRLESKMTAKRARHPEVKLDKSRLYILVYGWIDGLNAVQTAQTLGMTGASTRSFLRDTTLVVIHDLTRQGFRMLDIKPEHIILRIRRNGSLLRRKSGELAYALVDYELLERLDASNEPKSRKSKQQCVP